MEFPYNNQSLARIFSTAESTASQNG